MSQVRARLRVTKAMGKVAAECPTEVRTAPSRPPPDPRRAARSAQRAKKRDGALTSLARCRHTVLQVASYGGCVRAFVERNGGVAKGACEAEFKVLRACMRRALGRRP